MDHLVTPEDVQRFAYERTGTMIRPEFAQFLRGAIENYIVNKARPSEPPPPPYIFGPRSDTLSMNQRLVLCDFANGRSQYRIYDVAADWVGRVISPGLHVEHTSAIFLRKAMWKLKVHGPADEYLRRLFDEAQDLKPRECYPLDQYRRNIPRTVKGQLKQGRRYRIPKSQAVRAVRPFQLVHLPDDAGCYSVLPAELHLTKTFFAKHDEDISFGWSESQDLWVLWTEWIRWVIDHRRRPEQVYNPLGQSYDQARPMTTEELIRNLAGNREEE